jgi:hypothetical protein
MLTWGSTRCIFMRPVGVTGPVRIEVPHFTDASTSVSLIAGYGPAPQRPDLPLIDQISKCTTSGKGS